eukprot:scaffold5078_cov63-Phaeocystis_antarctica.AAC.1
MVKKADMTPHLNAKLLFNSWCAHRCEDCFPHARPRAGLPCLTRYSSHAQAPSDTVWCYGGSKQLYLSGSAGGAELRELLAYNESMDTDRPELDSGVASGVGPGQSFDWKPPKFLP